MGLKKGQTNNPNGRKKGSKNKRTIEWEQLGEFITAEGAKRAAKIMMECEDEQFMNHYKSMLEYFKPKQARTEITGDPDAPVLKQVYIMPDGSKLEF